MHILCMLGVKIGGFKCPTNDTHGGFTYISNRNYDVSVVAIVY